MAKTLDDIINENLKKGRAKIGFGLAKKDEEIIQSLNKAKEFADIVIVGPKELQEVEGFECVLVDNPEEKLAEMLYQGEVDGIVRGTIDDFKTFEAYQKLVGEERTKDMKELGILEDAFNRQFFVSEASNPSGWTKKEKIHNVEGIIEFMKELGTTVIKMNL